jgi:AraC-like DNA-binding protein
MRILKPAQIRPHVRIANYHPVSPGDHWINRRIPDIEFILIVAGEYDYIVEDQRWLLSEGDVLFIEPGVLHTKRTRPGTGYGRMSAIHLELVPDASWASGDYRLTPAPEVVTKVNDFNYLHTRFRRLAEVYAGYLPYRDELVSAIAQEIVIILAGHWQSTVRDVVSPRMQEMIAFIREHLHRPLSRHELAVQFHISPAYVNMLFKRELGTTPSALINRERVMAAYQLMYEQGISVNEVAYLVGYQDPFYFSRIFKHIMGIAPSKIASS